MDFSSRLLSSQKSARRPRRTSVRPLSQAFAKPSQASQTTKHESPTPAPRHASQTHIASSLVEDNWSDMLNAVSEDGHYKSDSTGDSNGSSSGIKRSSTPDSDVVMTQDEASQQVYVDPDSLSAYNSGRNQHHSSAQQTTWQLPESMIEVAYSRRHQEKFDYLGLSWGIQWETARIVTAHPEVTWDDIPLQALGELCGSSSEKAPRVVNVLLRGHPHLEAILARERTTRPAAYSTPWEEYDLEEASIRDGSEARLGCQTAYFGGKVDQVVRLTIEKGKFRFCLQPPAKSKSFRFRRYLGSRRLIEVRFSDEEPGLDRKKTMDFFKNQGLVINGRVFRAFYARSNAVHLVETNEGSFRAADPLLGDLSRGSLKDFIEWHNPLYANPSQTLTKWASRFALGFSDSQPGLSFSPANILFIPDIIAPGQTGNNAIMTDGSGYINFAALYQLTAKMKWLSVPVCVQARFGGSKGLFILHPSDRERDAEPRIYIRPSQIKVKLHLDPSRWCPSQRILDVLIRAPLSTSVQITDQVIMNLAHNGVGVSVLDTLTRHFIDSIDFIPHLRQNRCTQLWDTVHNSKKVQEYRLKGITPVALARAHGLSDNKDEKEESLLTGAKFSYLPDPFSGMPPNFETQALGLLQAGFDKSFYPLYHRLEMVHKSLLFGMDEKCHLRIPNSALAFVIPDPLGILEAGQVYCGFKTPVKDLYLERDIHCVTGPVIVTRNPCILPSDARKVMAVDCPQLWMAGYQDVIVFSTKGESSLASMLGGGDYDGDTVIMIWEHDIVHSFINSETHYPNVDVSENFDLCRTTMENVAPNDHQTVLSALLAPLMPTQVGMYGNWHVNAAKLLGLDHPATVRLGNIFTTCLDGVKTGLTIHRHVVNRDSSQWNNLDSNLPRKFTIIEQLKDVLDIHKRECEQAMNELRPVARLDSDLLEPYKRERALCARVPGLQEEIETITSFVDRIWKELREGEYSVFKRHGQPRFARTIGGKQHSTGERQESERAASEAYNTGMPRGFLYIRDHCVPRIAASYAYSRDSREEPKFSFLVAWDELCMIKAEARGRVVSMQPQFAEVMSISKRARQQLDLIHNVEDD